MKIWEAVPYIFNYQFNQVCSVFYDRYPNLFSKHIISEDVLSREITNEKIITRKLIVKKGASFLKTVPKWLTKYVSIQFMPTLEESIYDKKNSTLITHTRNVSWLKILSMNEQCYYKPLDLHSTKVCRKINVSVNYGNLSGLAERFFIIAFKKSIRRTVDGYLEKLQDRYGNLTLNFSSTVRTNNTSVQLISDKIRNNKLKTTA